MVIISNSEPVKKTEGDTKKFTTSCKVSLSGKLEIQQKPVKFLKIGSNQHGLRSSSSSFTFSTR